MQNVEVTQDELSAIAADLRSGDAFSIADRLQSNPTALATLQDPFKKALEEISLAALSVTEDVPEIVPQIHQAVDSFGEDMANGLALFSGTLNMTSADPGSSKLSGEIDGILRLKGVIEAFDSGDERLRLITALILYKKTEEFLTTLMQRLESDINVISISIGASEKDLDGKKQQLAKLTVLPEEERSDELQREIDLLEQDIQRLEGEGTRGDKSRSSGILPRAKARRQSRQKALDLVKEKSDLWEYMVACRGKSGGGSQYSATEIAYLTSSYAFDIREMIEAKLKPYIEKFKLSEEYAGLTEDNTQTILRNKFIQTIAVSALRSVTNHEIAAATASHSIGSVGNRNRLLALLTLILGVGAAATFIPNRTTDNHKDGSTAERSTDRDAHHYLSIEVFQQKMAEALAQEPIQMDSWLSKGSDGKVGIMTSPRRNKAILGMGADVDEVKVMSLSPTQAKSVEHGSLKNLDVMGAPSQGQSTKLDDLDQYFVVKSPLLDIGSYMVMASQPGLPFQQVEIGKERQAVVMNEGPDVQLFSDVFMTGKLMDKDATNPDEVLDVILPRLLEKDPVRLNLQWTERFYPPQITDFDVVVPDEWLTARFIQEFKVSYRTPLEEEKQGRQSSEVMIIETKRDPNTGRLIPSQKETNINVRRLGRIPTITITTPLGVRVYQNSGLEVTNKVTERLEDILHPDRSGKKP